MNEDFSDKVKTLLEDPEMLAKIVAIAGSLGGGNSNSPVASPEPDNSPERESVEQVNVPQSNSIPREPPEQANASHANASQGNAAQTIAKISSAINPSTPKDPRLSLLNSLKPFLREEKRAKIDHLAKALSVANLMGSFGKDKKL